MDEPHEIVDKAENIEKKASIESAIDEENNLEEYNIDGYKTSDQSKLYDLDSKTLNIEESELDKTDLEKNVNTSNPDTNKSEGLIKEENENDLDSKSNSITEETIIRETAFNEQEADSKELSSDANLDRKFNIEPDASSINEAKLINDQGKISDSIQIENTENRVVLDNQKDISKAIQDLSILEQELLQQNIVNKGSLDVKEINSKDGKIELRNENNTRTMNDIDNELKKDAISTIPDPINKKELANDDNTKIKTPDLETVESSLLTDKDTSHNKSLNTPSECIESESVIDTSIGHNDSTKSTKNSTILGLNTNQVGSSQDSTKLSFKNKNELTKTYSNDDHDTVKNNEDKEDTEKQKTKFSALRNKSVSFDDRIQMIENDDVSETGSTSSSSSSDKRDSDTSDDNDSSDDEREDTSSEENDSYDIQKESFVDDNPINIETVSKAIENEVHMHKEIIEDKITVAKNMIQEDVKDRSPPAKPSRTNIRKTTNAQVYQADTGNIEATSKPAKDEILAGISNISVKEENDYSVIETNLDEIEHFSPNHNSTLIDDEDCSTIENLIYSEINGSRRENGIKYNDEQFDGSIIGNLSDLSHEISECNSLFDSKILPASYALSGITHTNNHYETLGGNTHDYEEIEEKDLTEFQKFLAYKGDLDTPIKEERMRKPNYLSTLFRVLIARRNQRKASKDTGDASLEYGSAG